MMTPDQRQSDDAEYAAAFNEDQPQPPEQSEDEAFGLSDPAAQPGAEAQAQPPGGADAQTPTEAQGDQPCDDPSQCAPRDADEMQGQTGGAADGASDTAGQAPVADDRGAALDKKEQQLRSWEGRLKAIEANLAKQKPTTESAAVEALEDTGEQAEQQGNPKLGDAAEQAADAVEDGKMSVDQAMSQLAEDFGDDFVKMIQTIASHEAGKAGASAAGDKVSKVEQTVGEVIKSLSNARERDHYEAISEAHPDFNDVAKSAEFQAYIDGLPDADKANAQAVVKGGSARQVVRLLSAYKASMQAKPEQEAPASSGAVDAQAAAQALADKPGSAAKPKPGANESQLDAAEGVRSRGGLKLPDQPAASDDSFEDAWKSF